MSAQRKDRSRSISIRSRSDARAARTSLARTAFLVCGALLVPVGFRLLLLAEYGLTLARGDLRGLFSDLVTALGVAAIAGALARMRGWLGVGSVLLWTLLCYGNYEHVRANGANMALLYANHLFDETFFLGSVIAGAQLWLLAGGLLTALGSSWVALRSGASVSLLALVCGFSITGSVCVLWSESPETLGWRQSSFVAQNVSWLARRDFTGASRRDAPPAKSARASAPDLAGEPLVAFGDANTNVLLVMLEGVAGAYIEPIAVANERRPIRNTMPALSQLARENVFFTSFISHQRQTNRGQYAILCGELPRLLSVETKMTELALVPGARSEKRCLPAVLAEAGYATVYLQAAPMAFALKDRFMPKIGFQRAVGDTYFENAHSRTKWGVDDRTFFEQSLGMIEELRDSDRPWFLTLLTAGTHHPQNLPVEVSRKPGADRRHIAFRYLDDAVAEFIAELEARRIVDNTLVLLTSDESQGLRGLANDTQTRLSQSWGYLIAMLPERERLRVDVPQAQVDIALSTLDWLGLAEFARGFSGRSVFRRYRKPRSLVFGNTYLNWVGGVSEAGTLVMCAEDLQRCMHAGTDEQRLFKRGLTPIPPGSPMDVAFLREQVTESMWISRANAGSTPEFASNEERIFHLVGDEIFQIRDDVYDLQWVFGGQYLTTPPNVRIDVELDVELVGENGRIVVQHALSAGGKNLISQMIPDMGVGERLLFRYSYSSDEALIGIDSDLFVTRQTGSGMSLKFHRALMRFRPEARTEGPALVVHQFEREKVSGASASN